MAPRETPDDASRPLVERASHGDVGAVDALLAKHLPGLERYVRKRAGAALGARESASDLVQSTCREVLQHLDRYRYDGEEGFQRWLFATALRKIRDKHRFHLAEKRDARREVRPAPASARTSPAASAAFFRTFATPSREAVAREEMARIERTFGRLSESYRQVITLAQIEGLPSADVGRRMGITAGNARVLLSRALARFARLLREEGRSAGGA